MDVTNLKKLVECFGKRKPIVIENIEEFKGICWLHRYHTDQYILGNKHSKIERYRKSQYKVTSGLEFNLDVPWHCLTSSIPDGKKFIVINSFVYSIFYNEAVKLRKVN